MYIVSVYSMVYAYVNQYVSYILHGTYDVMHRMAHLHNAYMHVAAHGCLTHAHSYDMCNTCYYALSELWTAPPTECCSYMRTTIACHMTRTLLAHGRIDGYELPWLVLVSIWRLLLNMPLTGCTQYWH